MEEEEKRVLCDRLASIENELQRRDDVIQSLNTEKADLLEEIQKIQKRNKDLQKHLADSENAEYEALSMNDELKSSLEKANAKSKNETELYRSSLRDLQTELKAMNAKFAEALEKQDAIAAELLDKNNELEEMRIEKERMALDSSSRIANLNQILLKATQACSQQETRNEELQEQEKMLMAECETLEKKCASLSQRLDIPCPECVARVKKAANQSDDTALQKSLSAPVIPVKIVPHEQTELDKLKKENEKLSQKYECLLANFQMVSDKSSQLKEEAKEHEKTLVELQSQCDRLLSERQDLKTSMQNQVSCLKIGREESEKALSSAQLKIDELVNEIGKYREESDTSSERSTSIEYAGFYQEKFKQLEKEKDEIAKDFQDILSQYNTLHDQKANLEGTNKKLMSKLQRLESLVTKHEELKQSSTTAADEIQDLQSQLASLSERNESLVEENKALTSHKEDSSSHVQYLQKSVTKFQRESKHSWEMVHRLQKDLEIMESALLSTQESLEKKTQEYEALLNEMDRMKEDVKSSVTMKAALQEEICELYTKIDNLETSNFELHSRCSEVSSANNTSQASHRQAQEKLDDLQTRLTATQSVLYQKESQLHEAKITADTMTIENRKLLSQLDQVTQSMTRSNETTESLRSKLTHYENEVVVIAKGIADLEKEHLGCEPTRMKLLTKIDQLHEELQLKEEFVESAKEEVTSLQVEMKQLQQYNDGLEAIIQDLQDKMQLQLTKNDDLSLEAEEWANKMQQLKEQLDMKHSLMKDMEREKKQVKIDCEKQIEFLQKHTENVEGKYHKLQNDYDALLSNHNHTSSIVASLEQQLEETMAVGEEACKKKEQIADQMEILKDEKGFHQKQAETFQSQLKQMKRELHYYKSKSRGQERFVEKHMSQYSSTLKEFKSLRSDALQILSEASPNTSPRQSSYRSRRRHLSDDSGEVLRSLENHFEM